MTTRSPAQNHARRSSVSVTAIADCPFSIAQDYATEYLEAAESGGPEATIRPLPLPVLGHRVAIRFGLHFDVTEGGRQHDEIHIVWASGSRFLPDFRGTLRFRISGVQTEVLLDGSYAVPLGPVGRVFDAVIGRAIARGSLRDLARRIASTLAERQAAWRASLPAGVRQPAVAR